MKLRLQIDALAGEEIPRWYGLAWRDYNRDVGICYPMPLHFIFGWARLLWLWFRFHSVPTRWDTIRQAYEAGHIAGRQYEIQRTVLMERQGEL